MTLNPDQFHEHLDRLSEASGLQFGPNSISTRSGIVLPAMHNFNYMTSNYGSNSSDVLRLRSNTHIPDERGTKHHLHVDMYPSRGDEISSFGFSTVERNEDLDRPYGLSFISYSHGRHQDRRNIQVSSPEEMIERFKSEPIETSERTALESKDFFDYEQEARKESGMQHGESEVLDWRSNPSSSFAYDFRSRSMRPL